MATVKNSDEIAVTLDEGESSVTLKTANTYATKNIKFNILNTFVKASVKNNVLIFGMNTGSSDKLTGLGHYIIGDMVLGD